MKLSRILPSLTACAVAVAGIPQDATPPPPPGCVNGNPQTCDLYNIPTAYESAVQGRRILALTPLGVLSTIFPSSSEGNASDQESRPSGVGGTPVGLMDYIADCEDSGNPTILAINIATSFKNVAAGSNISLALQWTPPYPPSKRIRSVSSVFGRLFGSSDDGKEPVPYSAANLPRFSLVGYLEKIPSSVDVDSCFVKAHPDAKYWLPGNRIHESEFVRLVVQQVYWIGGFGDRAYIGWLKPEDWKSISRDEWESIRLPGEKKGWHEWSIPNMMLDL